MKLFTWSWEGKQIFDTKYKYLEWCKKTQISYIFNMSIWVVNLLI